MKTGRRKTNKGKQADFPQRNELQDHFAAVTFKNRFRKSRRNILDTATLLSLPQRPEAEARGRGRGKGSRDFLKQF